MHAVCRCQRRRTNQPPRRAVPYRGPRGRNETYRGNRVLFARATTGAEKKNIRVRSGPLDQWPTVGDENVPFPVVHVFRERGRGRKTSGKGRPEPFFFHRVAASRPRQRRSARRVTSAQRVSVCLSFLPPPTPEISSSTLAFLPASASFEYIEPLISHESVVRKITILCRINGRPMSSNVTGHFPRTVIPFFRPYLKSGYCYYLMIFKVKFVLLNQ